MGGVGAGVGGGGTGDGSGVGAGAGAGSTGGCDGSCEAVACTQAINKNEREYLINSLSTLIPIPKMYQSF